MTRQRILDIAARVFRQNGYSNARLSDIAAQAGIQTGSLYYHFESRNELVGEVLHVGIEMASRRAREAVEELPKSATPLQRLAEALRGHMMSCLETDDYTAAQLRTIGEVPPAIRKRHLADQRAYGNFWKKLFQEAIDSGELRPIPDPYVARMLALGVLNWSPEWYTPGGPLPIEVIANEAVNLILYGLARQPPET